MTDEGPYYVAAGHAKSVYHTDPDCRYYQRARNPRVSDNPPLNARACRHCAGTREHCDSPDLSIYLAARAVGESHDDDEWPPAEVDE